MALLTAVIPIGNTQGNLFHLHETLSECQTHDVEVVLVHDDYSDGTREAIENLRRGYPWVKVVNGCFRAPGIARNAGLMLIETEWFCFWDVDDKPNVSNVSGAVNRRGITADIIVGLFATEDLTSDKVKMWPYPRNKKNLEFEIALNPGIWRFVFKTREHSHRRFEDFSMGEDQLFLAQAGINFRRIEMVGKHFYTYIKNQTNQLTSDKTRTAQLKSVIELENLLIKKSTETAFVDFLIIKQSITLMKYGFFRDRTTIRAFLGAILREHLHFLHFLFVILNNKGRES